MKNMSVKWRVTLWYTALMTALAVAVLCLMVALYAGQTLSNARVRLRDAVERSFNEIEYEDGRLYFDDDLNHMGEGIALAVYDAQGALLYGRVPAASSGAPLLIMAQMQKVSSSGQTWFVYDICREVSGYGPLWVRGVASPEPADAGLRVFLRLSLVLLPVFVLLAALGGYSIVRRGLVPLNEMTDTAQRILEAGDLTQRIRLDKGGDEVHRLADTFDRMMDKLQAAFESERQFTSDVSHELRTPVSVILSQCEYALSPEAGDTERRQALSSVRRQAQKTSRLLAQMLLLARASGGRQALHPERIDLGELAGVVCEEQREAAAAKGVSLSCAAPPGLMVRADETMMMRLLINLISNAVTYGKPGGHVWVALSEEPEAVACRVSDDGIGIAPEHLDKIWNRLYQVDPARSSSGAGLGLPMARWIVQAHGGTIEVSSALGKGSAFTFRLPK